MKRYPIILLTLAVMQAITSCQDTGNKEIPVYEGPLRVIENVERYQSENDRITIKMVAPKVYEFQNGDVEFPDGVDMDFYNEFGKISSKLHANHAYYFKEEDQWRGRGDVEVNNIEKDEQLNTEELFWKPAEERIYTKSFFTLRQQDNVIYGDGLEAKQDLSESTFLNTYGDFEVEE